MERQISSEIDSNDFIIDVSAMEEIPIQYNQEISAAGNNNLVNNVSSQSYHHEAAPYKIGSKYRKKMTLNEEQSILLDRLSFNNNVFNEIEYCRVQILKQFLRTIDYLYKECVPVNRSYHTVIDELTEIIIVLEYNYKKDSLNYKYTFESIQSEIFNHLLKLCENNIRDFYEIKRKINTDFKYTNPEILDKFSKKIVSKVGMFLEEHKHLILDADYRTNLILNETHTNRWKTKFELIKSDYTNAVSFEREIARLAEVNVKNPSVDSLYFEASKFISGYDKSSALRLYIYYLDKDLDSQKFDRRQLNKTIQKSLFTHAEQFAEFESIVNEFVQNRDIHSCLEKLDKIYLPRRKKIVIDRNAIDRVRQLDSQTSRILGDLLADDEGISETGAFAGQAENNDDIEFKVIDTEATAENRKYLQELTLSDAQMDLLDYFEKNSLAILRSDLEDYMRARHLFMGAAIESVNDLLFDTLDDILIEEEDDYLTIHPEYYKKLLNND